MPSETKNRFLILYGSQTGQAKAIAEELQEKSDSYGLQSDLHCLSQTEKKFNLEREQCVVFVVSTTGDGEAPDTVQKFWRRLHKRTLSDTHLQHLHFSLLGLGDTNYTNFCKCGKGLDRRLELLGARRFYPSAWADDGVGLEVAAEPWIDGVLPAVRRFLGLPPISRQIEETIGRGDNSDTTTSDNLSELTSGTDNSESDATDSNQTNPSVRVPSDSQQTDPSNSGKTNGMTLVDSWKGIIPDSASTESPADLTQTPSVGSTDTASPADSCKLGRFESNGAADPVNIAAGGEGLGKEAAGRVTSLKWSAGLRESTLTLPLLPPPYLDLRFTESKGQVTSELTYQNGCPLPSASSPVTMATIVSARQLTAAEAVKTALDIELQTEPGTLGYAPGDSISVVCPNPEEEVCQLFNRLGVSGDQWYELSVKPDTKKRRAAIPPHLHPASTLHHAFSTCLDLRHPPKKALLRALVEVTSDPQEKRRLQELCSKQGAAEYSQFIHDASLSLLDILTAFPSCSPSVERLLEQLPRLQPRPYSVASSPLVHADRLHIVFNVVEVGGCEDRRARRGVCTGWLDHLTRSLRTGSLHQQLEGMKLTDTPQISIPIFGRTNQQFRMPEDLSVPLILIGPGTGVAPFVGFLQHREHLVANQKPENVGETWLFFGCRHQQRDFLYREELERLRKASVLTRLCASFSRDEDRGDNPRYVQDNLRLHGPEIVSLLEDHNASVFVCGDAKHMARNVNDQFVEIYEKCKGLTGGEARSRVMSLRLARRYLEDVWT